MVVNIESKEKDDRRNTWRVCGGRFASMREIKQYAQAQPLNPGCQRTDYLVERQGVGDPEWSGFTSQEDLFNRMACGLSDTSFLSEVRRFSNNVALTTSRVKARFRDVEGDEVDIGRYMEGIPECMFNTRRVTRLGRVVHIGVDVCAQASATAEDLRAIGEVIAGVVVAVEKKGYRIRLDAGTSIDTKMGESTALVMAIRLKTENQPMNYRRMLFPLADPAFLRGVEFGYDSRQSYCHINSITLGSTLSSGRRGDSLLDKVHALMFGPSATSIDLWLLLQDYWRLKSGGVGEEECRYTLTRDVIERLIGSGQYGGRP